MSLIDAQETDLAIDVVEFEDNKRDKEDEIARVIYDKLLP